MGIFNPKWMKDHKETDKLKDPEKLKRAALKGKTDKVRDRAVERLYVVNRDAFDDLVKHVPDSSVRRHAVSWMCIKERYKKGFIPVLQEISKKGDLKFICPSCGKIRTSSDASDASAFQKPCDCGCEERPIPVEVQFG